MESEVMILFVVAILLILLGIYLWRKGNTKESFWEALFDVVGDILVWDLPVFSTFRAWSLFLWLIGICILIVSICITMSKWF
ncbi:hypothetical protein ASE46_23585 [Bacillus sp. Root239]|nr:hypothetical protein ASE46_23585 [Bacillus sp. Root239]